MKCVGIRARKTRIHARFGLATTLIAISWANEAKSDFNLCNHTAVWLDVNLTYGSANDYGERIFALEHKTLSLSPIDNACDVLETLPENAILHLVSHSRGGLIGELLCRGQLVARDEAFAAEEIALLETAGQREQIARLGKLLQAKRPKVERFVRVACPARGTILASERLDRGQLQSAVDTGS